MSALSRKNSSFNVLDDLIPPESQSKAIEMKKHMPFIVSSVLPVTRGHFLLIIMSNCWTF